VHEDPAAGYLYLGTKGSALTKGQIAHGYDRISANGDAQSSQIVLNGTVAGASAVVLLSSGSGIAIPTNGVIGFEAHFVAVASDGTSTFLKFEGAAKNFGAGSLVGTVTQFTVAEDTPGMHKLEITITGNNLKFGFDNIIDLRSNAACYVRYTQTIY
jgi:PPE-repeat protein